MYLTWEQASQLVSKERLRQAIDARKSQCGEEYGDIWRLECGAVIAYLKPTERKKIRKRRQSYDSISFAINGTDDQMIEVDRLLSV